MPYTQLDMPQLVKVAVWLKALHAYIRDAINN